MTKEIIVIIWMCAWPITIELGDYIAARRKAITGEPCATPEDRKAQGQGAALIWVVILIIILFI